MRLFIALDLSDDVKHALADNAKKIKEIAKKGSFSREKNFHVTLAFLGEVPEYKLKAVIKAISSVEMNDFEFVIEGLSYFDSADGKIYWRGIKRSEELNALARAVSRNLMFEGFLPDSKPYRPHITLARRCKADISDVSFEPIVTNAGKISVMRSQRCDGKLAYTEIYHKKLL